MTFLQNQEITIPEKVGFITELIADYCYRGLSHIVCIVANWCEFVHVLLSSDSCMLKIQQYKRKTLGFHTFTYFGPYLCLELTPTRHQAMLNSSIF